MASISRPTSNVYQGNSTITFSRGDNGLAVNIETSRLSIRSITKNDLENCKAVYCDSDVMRKYGYGVPKATNLVELKVATAWTDSWGNNNPYGHFCIFTKDKTFIGEATLTPEDNPKEVEIGYLFVEKQWGQGYGKEAVAALMTEYAPLTVTEGYVVPHQQGDGVLETIIAAARPDNPASVKILESVGMEKVKEEEKYGAFWNYYSIDLKTLQEKNTSKIVSVASKFF